MPGTQGTGDRTVTLTIVAADRDAFSGLLGEAGPQPGATYDILPEVRLAVLSHTSQRGWGQPEVVDSALTFAANVSPTVIAAWLAERLSGRRVRLEIGGQAVDITDQASISGRLAADAPQARTDAPRADAGD